MPAIEFNWKPTDRQLRQFAIVSLIALPLVAYVFTGRPDFNSWQPQHTLVIGGMALVGLLLTCIGWLKPRFIRPVFILACLLAFPIGIVVGEFILLIIFLLIFTPIAIIFRLVGRDALERGSRRGKPTYWKDKRSAPDIRSYFRQS